MTKMIFEPYSPAEVQAALECITGVAYDGDIGNANVHDMTRFCNEHGYKVDFSIGICFQIDYDEI